MLIDFCILLLNDAILCCSHVFYLFQCISVGLSENRLSNLLTLHLNQCGIGDRGGKHIADMVTTENR